jgi:hypothetical protein
MGAIYDNLAYIDDCGDLEFGEWCLVGVEGF